MRNKITEVREFSQVVQEYSDVFNDKLKDLNGFINADLLFLAALDHEAHTAKSLLINSLDGTVENFSYALNGTPCESVSRGTVCSVDENVTDMFPDDELLKDMGVQAYLGIPLSSDERYPLAILVALFKRPTQLQSLQYPFRIFASYLNSLSQSFFVTSNLNSQLELLQALGSITKAGAWEYSLRSGDLYWSDEIYDIHGLPKGSEVSPGISIQHYSPEDRERINDLFQQAVVSGKSYQLECEFRDQQGTKKWVRTSGRARKNKLGEVIGVYGGFEDITEERNLLNSEKYEREYLKSVLNSMNDAVVTITKNGRILDANNAASDIFGYEKVEMRGLSVTRLMPEPYASEHSQYVKEYLKTGNGKIMGRGRQLPALRKNGDTFQMELVLSQTKFNEKTIFIGLIRDISERIRAQETVYKAAYTDRITGLKNRSWFEREIRDFIRLSAFQEKWLYCALVDIDKLSLYNMRYGFVAGDKLIKQVAVTLRRNLPETIKLFKNSPDSFFVLFEVNGRDIENMLMEKDKLENKILFSEQYSIKFTDKTETPSLSLGSVVSKASEISYENLIDVLEYARDTAKMRAPSGRCFMGYEQQEEYKQGKKIRDRLESVTQSGELSLVLQPQFINENEFISSEALLRWISPDLGFVSPGVFIPLAEESDVIIEIGEWVLEEVCRLLAQLQRMGVNTRIAVNISGRQIVHKGFKERLLAITHSAGVSPECLILELTETTLVSDIQLVKQIMLSLNDEGFRFSIDDFGTGYSSLSYLKEMPISELKIDKCFIDEIENENSPATIVDVIINMSKALKVKCVAEGVEYQAQYEYLKSKGCDLSQGYLFSKPLKIEEWKKRVIQQSTQPELCH